jgi:hypothetical protein
MICQTLNTNLEGLYEQEDTQRSKKTPQEHPADEGKAQGADGGKEIRLIHRMGIARYPFLFC